MKYFALKNVPKREISLLPNKPSSVIVYSDEQIQDMISNCIGTNGSVIGIGRSFNLRSCFVTTTTYKILVILQRETLQNLILLDTRDITKYNFNGTDISPLGRQN